LARIIRRLDLYENPKFCNLPQSCRNALVIFHFATPRHTPYGIIDFRDNKTLKIINDNIPNIRSCISTLGSDGMITADRKFKIIFLHDTFKSHIFQSPSPREISYWKKFISGNISHSNAIQMWKKELRVDLKNFPTRSRKAVIDAIFPDESSAKTGGSRESREVIEYFTSRFSELGYGSYVPKWGRESVAVSDVLDSIDIEEMKARIDRYLSNDWYMKNQGADIIRFCSLINRFAQREEISNEKSPGSDYWDIVKKRK